MYRDIPSICLLRRRTTPREFLRRWWMIGRKTSATEFHRFKALLDSWFSCWFPFFPRKGRLATLSQRPNACGYRTITTTWGEFWSKHRRLSTFYLKKLLLPHSQSLYHEPMTIMLMESSYHRVFWCRIYRTFYSIKKWKIVEWGPPKKESSLAARQFIQSSVYIETIRIVYTHSA